MKHLAVIVLFLITVMVGCCTALPPKDVTTVTTVTSITSQRTVPVYIDEHFSIVDRSYVVDAVQVWNRALQGHVYLDIVDMHAPISLGDMRSVEEHHGLLIMQVDSTCTFLPADVPRAVAWADYIGGTKVWMVHDRLWTSTWEQVAMHEIGHILGADDRDGPGLMHRTVEPAQWACVDQATAQEVATHFGLELSDLKYCTEKP